MQPRDLTTPAKKKKQNRFAHTPTTQRGEGDYTGTAVKNPTGKYRSRLIQ